ncbi:GmrSD restriction endonuclease domain-containing protein [Phyllobacterium endophyticum]|uniref:GmrSD restriction endonuclease domain-containing protein n=1 Tax=Phyllobacterium endophyticum TaxID=1149773 RepID=UPI0011C73CDF|nr:DUF262 domain-containing protein [Phyllobacterium endophyticum]TXR47550.1 DUF262 domain-containing protein [Phyllobacterium endophyticum]
MAGTAFKTNPFSLHELLTNCQKGVLQLPDFQRSWVWDEDRIKSLVASVSRAFPVGALMTLETGGDVNFKPRPVEGTPDSAKAISPSSLLLDGQQRMTSLYQVTIRNKVVETVTPKNKRVKRWFYIDIEKALDAEADREEAIVGIPEDRIVRTDFGRETKLDLSSRKFEHASMMFPLTEVFDWDDWQDSFNDYWQGEEGKAAKDKWRSFKKDVLENFKSYQVPVITLDKWTTKEAVCTVFEKVNTGGKPLDAFELVTAMYAAEGFELRKDWYGAEEQKGRHQRLAETLRPAGRDTGILVNVANTDLLQVVSLFHTRDKRREAEAQGKQGKDLPQVTGNRQALLNLPLIAYKAYCDKAAQGFERAAKFLFELNIYKVEDLPYQSQIVPLAAILAENEGALHHATLKQKLQQWYWNGVFGELYGSAVDTRVAKDFMEVPIWLQGGAMPSTVSDTTFRADRLKTMRMRLSAAYKGMNALLMKEGALDFRSGLKFDHIVFFGESVDIHHIFPKKWCEDNKIKSDLYDSIINKTPLTYRTNRIIGGVAPSAYLATLENGTSATPPIDAAKLDDYLASHLIDPVLLRTDRFGEFMAERQRQLLALIEKATGKQAYRGDQPEEGVDAEAEGDAAEAVLTIAAE